MIVRKFRTFNIRAKIKIQIKYLVEQLYNKIKPRIYYIPGFKYDFIYFQKQYHL